MKGDGEHLLRFLPFLVVFMIAIASIADLNRPYWGDEAHFVATVRHFGQGLDVDTIAHYNEMSTPLPFVAYSLWGRAFGFDISILRILSMLIALATYLLFHHLVYRLFRRPGIAHLATAFLALHPYMVGLSIFVFTDMTAILFVVLFLLAVEKRSPFLLAMASTGGLLSRQYFVFLPIAAVLYYPLGHLWGRRDGTRKMTASIILSFCPLVLLFILWKGLSPDSPLRALYLGDGLGFHPSSLTLYIGQFFLYLLPFVLYRWRDYYGDMKVLLATFVLSWVYGWLPVAPSAPALEAGIDTVGLFHRLVRATIGSRFEGVVFYVAFWLGLPVVLSIAADGWRRLGAKSWDFVLFLDISIAAFLAIMPFSYLAWEKYFLMVMPLAIIQVLSKRREVGRSGTGRAAPIPPRFA